MSTPKHCDSKTWRYPTRKVNRGEKLENVDLTHCRRQRKQKRLK